MRQLQFDTYTGNIIEAKIDYWQGIDDIPIAIRNFIYEKTTNYILRDEYNNKNYCPLCTHEIDEYGFCQNCQKFCNISNDTEVKIFDIDKIKNYAFFDTYYIFDVVNNEVILYVIDEHVYYDHPNLAIPYRIMETKIDHAYHVLNNKIIDLNGNVTYLYKDIDKQNKKDDEIYNYRIDNYLNNYDDGILYTDNLDLLKDTIYRYTNIWLAKEYLKNQHLFVSNLTYIPLHFSCFEYLIKDNFYSLAFDNPHLLKYDNEARMLLNPNGEYFDFMLKNNFDFYQYKSLQICKTKNIRIINFMVRYLYIVKQILEIKKIDIVKLYYYLKKQNVNIVEYRDYLNLARDLGYNLKEKNVIFPKSLMEEHNKLFEKKYIIFDKSYDKKIKEISSKLIKNKYEDNNYVIYPASSVKEMLDEGKNQNNCLRTYIKDYSNGNTEIYFMRKKSNLNKSFVTIEVKDNELIQARLKNNLDPSENIMKIINKWLMNLNNKIKIDIK